MKRLALILCALSFAAYAYVQGPDSTVILSEDEALEMAVSINNLQVQIADQAYELANPRRELKTCKSKVEI